MHASAPPYSFVLLVSAILIVVALPLVSATWGEEQVAGKRLEIIRNQQSVSVRQGDRLLLEYRYDGVSHKPYVRGSPPRPASMSSAMRFLTTFIITL